MADPSPLDRFTKSPENTDRAFVAAASTVWLIVLALAVLAIISLVRLGSGPQVPSGGEDSSGSTWWLWLIIGVSAAIIAGAMRRTRSCTSSARLLRFWICPLPVVVGPLAMSSTVPSAPPCGATSSPSWVPPGSPPAPSP